MVHHYLYAALRSEVLCCTLHTNVVHAHKWAQVHLGPMHTKAGPDPIQQALNAISTLV